MITKLLGRIVARSVSAGFTVAVAITTGVMVAGPAGAATLVGTTSDATGIDGVVVDGTSYNVTFVNDSYNNVYATTPPTFLGEASTALDAETALAAALNTLSVTALTPGRAAVATIPYMDNGMDATDTAALYEVNTDQWVLSPATTSDSTVYTVYDFTVFVPSTPLPPAIFLFASGLGAAGLLGWRKKRTTTAAIAAT